jgi:hypothetical protein
VSGEDESEAKEKRSNPLKWRVYQSSSNPKWSPGNVLYFRRVDTFFQLSDYPNCIVSNQNSRSWKIQSFMVHNTISSEI